MRWLMALMLAGGLPAAGEIRDVLKSAQIDRTFARAGESLELHKRPNYAIVFRVDTGGPRDRKQPGADEVWLVHKGGAALSLDGKHYRIGAGDFVHVPRGASAHIDPGGGRLETIVVQVFPEGSERPSTSGGFLSPRRMPDVVTNAQVEETLATHDTNQPLHAGRNFTMNYVIYPARPGPWEAHRGCVDIYFLRTGTAHAQLGGEIAGAKEESPGEIRGSGVAGARSYTIGPGDLVVIPRNTAHHMDPGTGKLGYLLLKVWAE